MAKNGRGTRAEPNKADVIRFEVLPDDVLLDIFDFYVGSTSYKESRDGIEAWQSLVHVCRRWRSLVFQSPRRLNLRLLCTPETHVRVALDTWPALHLVITNVTVRAVRASSTSSSGIDNIIAALGHSNRVYQVILLSLADRQMEQVLAAMQVPFPELTSLYLSSRDETPVIPDSFLGGSAPRLRHLHLSGVPFPGLPTLLLSATHFVSLWLYDIPPADYISPGAMVPLLSALSSLQVLSLEFESPQSRSNWQSPSLPPPNRSILPALEEFRFKGDTEYLEDFVSIVDAPQLNKLQVAFLNQVTFNTRRLSQFVNRTSKLGKRDEAHVEFEDGSALVRSGTLRIFILCREPDLQLSSVAQVCNFSLPSAVEDLYIKRCSPSVWQTHAIENTLWLQLLRPFTAVKNLYLYKDFAPGIAAALQELVGARITEVLPSLQNIFVDSLEPSGPFQENIGQFVAARQLSAHPIAISDWYKNW